MKSRVWNHVFLPVLQDWALLWVGSEFEVQFIHLAHPVKSKSKLRPELNAIEWLVAIIMIIFFLSLIVFSCYNASKYHAYDEKAITSALVQQFFNLRLLIQ